MAEAQTQTQTQKNDVAIQTGEAATTPEASTKTMKPQKPSLDEQETALRRKSVAEILKISEPSASQPLYQQTIEQLIVAYGDKYLNGKGVSYESESEAISVHNAIQEYQKQARKIKTEMVSLYYPGPSTTTNIISEKILTDEYFKIEAQFLTSLAKFSRNIYTNNGASPEEISKFQESFRKSFNGMQRSSKLIGAKSFEDMKQKVIRDAYIQITGEYPKQGQKIELDTIINAASSRDGAQKAFRGVQLLSITNPNTTEIMAQAFPDIGYNFSDYQVSQGLGNPDDLRVGLEQEYNEDEAIKVESAGPTGIVDFFKSASAFNNETWNEEENAYWSEYGRIMRNIRTDKPQVSKKANRNAVLSTMLFPPIVPVAAVTKGISMGLSYLAKPLDGLANKCFGTDNGLLAILGGALKAISIPLKAAATVVNFASNVFMSIANSITRAVHKSAQRRLTNKITRGVKKQMKAKKKMKKQQATIDKQQQKLETLKNQLERANNAKDRKKIQAKINSVSADLLKLKQAYINSESKFKATEEKLAQLRAAREKQLETPTKTKKKAPNSLTAGPLAEVKTESGAVKGAAVVASPQKQKEYERIS